MATWLTSDLHFGHIRIMDFCPGRPGQTLEEMNEALVTLWNETVRPNDFVWILGDAVMGKRNETLQWITKLHGTKLLIPGNHDYCHPMNKRHQEWKAKYFDAGLNVQPTNMMVTFPVIGQVEMNHFPHTLSEYDDRDFADWGPKNPELPLIHGHVHDTWKVNGKQVNVGCDVWDYRPVHLDQIIEIIKSF